MVVKLAWDLSASGEGDWADRERQAVKMLAEEMARSPDSGIETAANLARFVTNATQNASNLRRLFSGPGQVLSEEAIAGLAAISCVLAKYRVEAGE